LVFCWVGNVENKNILADIGMTERKYLWYVKKREGNNKNGISVIFQQPFFFQDGNVILLCRWNIYSRSSNVVEELRRGGEAEMKVLVDINMKFMFQASFMSVAGKAGRNTVSYFYWFLW